MDAKQHHQQQMQDAETAHLDEMAELRQRVMELSGKDNHTAAELAEMDALRSRVLDLQVNAHSCPALLTCLALTHASVPDRKLVCAVSCGIITCCCSSMLLKSSSLRLSSPAVTPDFWSFLAHESQKNFAGVAEYRRNMIALSVRPY